MQNTLTAALCQLMVTDHKETNLANAEKMIDEAAGRGADLVVLPEMFNCPYDNQAFPSFAEPIPAGPTARFLSAAAKNRKLWIVGGSIPEMDENGFLYNTSTVFSPGGDLIAKHRKIHLFDVQIEGGVSFQESAMLSPGHQATVFDTPFGRIGLAICYDLRFPELARMMVLHGARILIYPGAFNATTGPAHWELLLRTRAVDNQCFVIGAAPALNPCASYAAYGHSMAVDPWGRIIEQAAQHESLIIARLEMEHIAKVRAELPLLQHRRRDMYALTPVESLLR